MNDPLRISQPDGSFEAPAAVAPAAERAAWLAPHDLEKVLHAWHEATDRLQKTHEALREEVMRLTAELETKNRELARRNRLADLGQMASHIAHEVRNGLMPLTLYLSLLRRRVTGDSAARETVDKIKAALTALDSTVNDLLHFTSDRDPNITRFRLLPLVEEVQDALAPQLVAQSIAAVTEIDPALELLADRDMLRRALLNLVLNAVDALPAGGCIEMRASSSCDGAELLVCDNGPGLVNVSPDKIFEPFFTTKSTGTGLGLAIVQRIADVHSGQVTAGNRPSGGAVFSLRIPHRRQEAAA